MISTSNRWARYASTLNRMGPWALTQFAVRRTYRSSRQWFSTTPAYSENRLRILFGKEGEADRIRPMLFSGRPHVFADTSFKPSVRKALESVPGAAASTSDRGDALLARTFRIFGETLSFGPGKPIAWHRDSVSGFCFPRHSAQNGVPLIPGSDPKYPWALARLESAVGLAQAAWVSDSAPKRHTLVNEWVAQVTSFLDENPVGMGINWTCPMEVALRATNMAIGLRMLAEEEQIQEPHFLRRVLIALSEHNAFVENHLEDGWSVPNNHLVSNWVGIMTVAALFPGLPNAPYQTELAAKGLARELQAQVHSDGYSFEDSVPYHRLAVELFTLGLVAARSAGIELGPAYLSRLRRMYQVVRAYASQHGLAPQLGDNDSGHAFSWTDRQSLDHGYLCGVGATLFSAPELKSDRSSYPEEAAWLFGVEGLRSFQRLPPTLPPRIFSSKGGLNVLRCNRAVVCFNAGPVGQRGVGGHSHNDRLSFELHVDGRPLIVDAGTGGYTRHAENRNAFRSIRAHNTIEVDETEPAPLLANRLFSLEDFFQSGVRITGTPSKMEAEANHDAYLQLVAPVRHERKFQIDLDQNTLQITDELQGQGFHQVSVRWLLAPGITAVMRSPKEIDLQEGKTLHARMVIDTETANFQITAEPALYSPGYGECVNSVRMIASARVQLPWTFRATFSFTQKTESLP